MYNLGGQIRYAHMKYLKIKGQKKVQIRCYEKSEDEEMISSFWLRRRLSGERTHGFNGPLGVDRT